MSAKEMNFARTIRWTIDVTALAAAVLFPWPAAAACAVGPTSFCQRLPDRTNGNSAIFLGRVTRVVTPTPAPPTPPQQGNSPSSDARRRAGDPILSAERTYPTARFQVLEGFAGVEPGDFEVRLTSDYFVNGIPQQVPAFAEGEIWLVEAYRDPGDGRWTTSNCQRTKPAVKAEEDLRVLRAWGSGQTLPGRVDGEVFHPVERRSAAGVRIYLRGAKQVLSATTDSAGRFVFENLAPGIYEAAAVLSQGGGPVKVDLTQAWCSRVVFLVR